MQPFEEQTTTMIVFPQGGVLRMSASVGAGQMLVLTNLKSKQDAICRVLKVRSFPNMQAYVEVEFTQAQPGYWGVYFAADGSAGTAKPAPPSAAPPPEVKQKNDLEVSWAPAPTAAPPKPIETTTYPKQARTVVPSAPAPPPAKPVSAFVSIGSQEDVQLAASSTREIKAVQPPEIPSQIKVAPAAKVEKEIRATEVTPTPVAPAASAESSATLAPALPTTLSLADLRGDDETVSSIFASLDSEAKQSAADSKAAEGGRAFGSFGAAPAPAAEHAAAAGQDFGARLDAGVGGASPAAESKQNWMLIAACVAVLFLAAGAGVLYFRPKPANTQAVATALPAQQTATQETAAPSAPQLPVSHPAQSPTQSSAPADSSSARIGATSAPSVAVNTSSSSTRSSKPVPAPSQPAAAVDQPAAAVGQPTAASASPNMLATTMNAHPVSSQRAVEQNDAPTLDSATSTASQPGDLPGVGSASVAAPPPPDPSSEGPVQVGGTVKEPKLISSVPVVYPSVAKDSRVQGDVVVDTQIDKNGNVVHMKVTSGPMLLRQAALDAVRKWKYEPSTLDGQPVSVEMLVTVKFRL